MADIFVQNYARDTTNANDLWCVYWRGLCALMRAGWRLVACSDGNATKRTATSTPPLSPFDPSNNNLVGFENVGSGGTGPTLSAFEQSSYVTVTGLSGLVAATSSLSNSEGRWLQLAGFANAANNGRFQIVDVLSATSCKILNPSAVAADANNGAVGVTWQEQHLATTYVPGTWDTRAPWAVLAGPRMVRLELSAAPVGFLPGEEVTQGSGTTQRRGRLLGFVMGATTGWLVVEPFDYGTWDTSTVTGVSSGATLPAASLSSTPKVYAVEVVFAKSSASFSQGSLYWLQADTVGENAQLFSTLATGADATATSAPGFTGAAAAGSFPACGVVLAGTVKSNAPAQAAAHGGLGQVSSGYAANAQILCANALPRPPRAGVPGRCADGSFWLLFHSGSSSTQFLHGTGFLRLDDTEPADVSPFLSFFPSNSPHAGFNRQQNTGTNSTTAMTQFYYTSSAVSTWRGYAGRGALAARDVVQGFLPSLASSDVFVSNAGAAARLASHPDATPPLRRESPLYYYDGSTTLSPSGTSVKVAKGRPRWLTLLNVGAGLSTYDNLRWVAIEAASGSTRAWAVGPCDGVTTPVGS